MKTKLLIISLLLGFQYGYTQLKTTGDVIKSTANSFILDQPLDNNTSYEYTASNYINLEMGDLTGFGYLPTGDNYFEAKTDPLMVIPPTEGEFGGAPNNDEGGVVGTIPGSFSVSPTGAAIYTVPIDLPPGINGMTPKLGLVYNSKNTMGNVLGVGWSIAGLSSISRNNPTQYYNGEKDNIDFDNDQLMLDGNYLIQISDNATEIVYRTENDGNVAIVTYHKNPILYTYPYFSVRYKNGITKYYGNTEDSRQNYTPDMDPDAPVIIWHISKVMDLYGNYITYAYWKDKTNGEVKPTMILYSSHTNASKDESINYSVNFNYNNLSPENIKTMYYEESKLSGNLKYLVKNSYKLSSLSIKLNGDDELSKYTFRYQDNTNLFTSDLFLKNIYYLIPDPNSADPDDTHDSLNSTRFDWSFYTPNYELVQKSDDNDLTHSPLSTIGSIDIDGDGVSELMEYKYIINDVEDKKFVEIYAPGEGGDNIIIESDARYLSLDVDNDGNDELVLYDNTGFNIFNFVYDPVLEYFTYEIVFTYAGHNGDMYVGDFNGDGLQDLLMQYESSKLKTIGDKKLAFFFLLQDNSSGDFFNITEDIDISNDFDCHSIIDFNGDGISDIVFQNNYIGSQNCSYEIKTFSGSSLDVLLSSFGSTIHSYFNDFNRDGKTDLCEIDENFQKTIKFSYGSGYDTPEQNILLSSYPSAVIDMNNDRIPDFVFVNGNYINNIGVTIYYGTPDGIHICPESLSNSYTPCYYNSFKITFADFTGNGSNDIGIQTFRLGAGSGDPGHVNAFVIIDYSNHKSLITKITNGLGKESHIQYRSFSTTYKNIDTLMYPLANFKSHLWLVRAYWEDSLLNYHAYAYKSPIVHQKGKGFLGFLELFQHTLASNTILHTIYDIKVKNELYYSLYPSESDVLFNDMILKHQEKKFSIFNPDFNYPLIYKPYPNLTLTKIWDGDELNTYVKSIITRIDGMDTYGNVTGKTILQDEAELEADALDGDFNYKTSISLEYYPPPVDYPWLTHRLKTKTTEKYIQAESVNMDKNIIAYDYYDDENNLPFIPWQLLSMTVTPNDDDHFAIQEVYDTYDNYGHLLKKTTQAINPSPPYDNLPIIETYFEYNNDNPDYFHRFLTRKYQKIDGILKEETEESYDYDEITGKLIKSVDPLGNETTYEYDLFGRRTTVKLPDGNIKSKVMRWSENDPDNPDGGIYYVWEKSSGETPVKTFFDELGRALRAVSNGFDENQIIYNDKSYNDKGLLARKYNPYFSTDNTAAYTEYTYNDLLKVNDISYFDNDGVTLLRSKLFDYAGRQTTITSNQAMASETISIKTKNALGQIDSIENPTGTVRYSYLASGLVDTTWVRSLDDNSVVITTMTYDAAGNQSQLDEPNSGISQSVYDALGRLRSSSDATANSSAYEYDALSRLTKLNITQGPSALGGDIDIQYEYYTDETLDGFGKLKSLTNTSNAIHYNYTYDDLGRLLTETESIDDDHTYTNEYTYDVFGRLKNQTYPTGLTTTNYYKPTGFLGKIKETENDDLLWEANTINQFGQITEFSLGNDLVSNYQYDNFGYLESIATGDGTIQQLEFDFDPATGNLNSRDDHTNGKSLHEAFAYDLKLHDRLTSWQVGTSGDENTTDYFDNGNIKTKTDISVTADSYQYSPAKPHAVTDIADVNADYEAFVGNAVQQVFYNAFRKTHSVVLENAKKVEFTYGPDGSRKIMQTYDWDDVNAVWVLFATKYYALGNLEREELSNGDSRQLLYVGGFVVREQTNDNTPELYYVHTDYLGSVQAITNSDGSLKQFLSFDPWGRRRDADTWSYTIDDADPWISRGFTGHEHLYGFGLINMNGRMYDPWVGRFLAPDPIVQQPGNPQSYNRYSYALNNPLKYTDPSGYAAAPILYEDQGANGANQYAVDWLNKPRYTGENYWTLTGLTDYHYSDKHNNYYVGDGPGGVVSYEEVYYNYIIPNSELSLSGEDVKKYFNNQKESDNAIAEEAPNKEKVWLGPNSWVLTTGMNFDPGDDGDDGEAGGDVPFGGIMFYSENGSPLYVSGLGNENVIYTIINSNISDFQHSLSALNPKSSPITVEEAKLLADVYSSNSYNVISGYGNNGNPYTFGYINAPWYMYVAAGISISGEAFAAGYNSGRAYRNYGKWGYEGFSNHYNSSLNYGITNQWSNYFGLKTFDPWW